MLQADGNKSEIKGNRSTGTNILVQDCSGKEESINWQQAGAQDIQQPVSPQRRIKRSWSQFF